MRKLGGVLGALPEHRIATPVARTMAIVRLGAAIETGKRRIEGVAVTHQDSLI